MSSPATWPLRRRWPKRSLPPAQIARLDPAAVEQVRHEAWPRIGSPDELHDALVLCGFLTQQECGPPTCVTGETADGNGRFGVLALQGRGTRIMLPHGGTVICAAERLAELRLVHPDAEAAPAIRPPPGMAPPADREQALREIIRSRLECLGPVTAEQLGAPLGLAATDTTQALVALENEGFAVRGLFDEKLAGEQWCERRLLARIHRYTVKTLRKAIAPVGPAAFMRFLFHWQGLAGRRVEGIEGAAAVLDRLAGFSCAAAAWEEDILPSRISNYAPELLDAGSRSHYEDPAYYDQTYRRRREDVRFYRERIEALLGGGDEPILELGVGTGRVALGLARAGIADYENDRTRLWVHDDSMEPLEIINEALGYRIQYFLTDFAAGGGRTPVRTSQIAILPRQDLWIWQDREGRRQAADDLSAQAIRLLEIFRQQGARFFTDIVHDSGMARREVETALGELVAAGLASADSYAAPAPCALLPAIPSMPPAAGIASTRHLRSTARNSAWNRLLLCCSIATESSSARCWNAKKVCRPGVPCCVPSGGSRRAARPAAGASSRDSAASSSPTRRPSSPCAGTG